MFRKGLLTEIVVLLQYEPNIALSCIKMTILQHISCYMFRPLLPHLQGARNCNCKLCAPDDGAIGPKIRSSWCVVNNIVILIKLFAFVGSELY
jgi:hypothetical protein